VFDLVVVRICAWYKLVNESSSTCF